MGDQVLDLIGKMGKWQAIIIFLVAYPGIITSWQILVMSFLTPEVDFFCVPDVTGRRVEASNYSEWRAELDTPIEIFNRGKQENDTLMLNSTSARCNASVYDAVEGSVSVTDRPCTRGWTYDLDFYQQTIVSQFDLVCSNDYLVTVSQSVYMLGILIGVIVSGIISDKFGRKYTIMGFAILLVIFGIAAAYANSFPVFIALRFCIAFCNIAAFTTAFVYCLEMVGGIWSVIVGIGLEFPWALGYSVLPAVAYAVPHWSWLQLTISLPILPFILVTFILPESPRWLLSQGRLEEAEDVLDRGMEINGRAWPDGHKLHKTGDSAGSSSANFLDLFRTPNLRKKTFIQYFLWFTCSFVYYGLTLNTGTLIPEGDLHINFMVSGLIEFPAYALTIVVLLFLGRRVPLSAMLFLAGISYVISCAVPAESTTALLVISSIGKFGVTAAFAVIYLYAAELFPTVLRQTGLGSSSMCARVGSVLAPIVGRELGKINRVIPMLIFAVVSLLGGFATLALPETRGGVMPDTVEEGEEFGKGQRICDCSLYGPVDHAAAAVPGGGGHRSSNGNKNGVDNRGFN